MIYADFNATTPVCIAANDAMQEVLENWGNPSSSHALGRKSLELLEKYRDSVATRVGRPSQEVVFTSGGSEANHLAIVGACLSRQSKPFTILTTPVEHSSQMGAVRVAQMLGAKVIYLKMESHGGLDLGDFELKLKEFRPTLVSIMSANNETGVIFPVQAIAEICSQAQTLFHTDAVQAFGKAAHSEWNGADLISISSHKIYGPKGSGALIVRKGIELQAFPAGGSQELKRRGGTQNMLGIAGFAGACGDWPDEVEWAKMSGLRDLFESMVLSQLDGINILGKDQDRVPNTSSLCVDGIDASAALSALDLDGICLSAGSACSSGSLTPSHVLTAMGLSMEEARTCVRISWGRSTTATEVETAADRLVFHVKRIRSRRSRTEIS